MATTETSLVIFSVPSFCPACQASPTIGKWVTVPTSERGPKNKSLTMSRFAPVRSFSRRSFSGSVFFACDDTYLSVIPRLSSPLLYSLRSFHIPWNRAEVGVLQGQPHEIPSEAPRIVRATTLSGAACISSQRGACALQSLCRPRSTRCSVGTAQSEEGFPRDLPSARLDEFRSSRSGGVGG